MTSPLDLDALHGQTTMGHASAAGPFAGPPGYELLEEVGRGGMGVVYRARHAALNRIVALKVILSGGHASQSERDRFRAEAEAIARLTHPNIVQVFEVGRHEATEYLALEFCADSLDRRLAGSPLPPREAAALLESLARAVQAAHEAGVVHRDLKPANVLLSEGERGALAPRGEAQREAAPPSGGSHPPLANVVPKIADFGLAKRLDGTGQTQTGAILGTPSYMAPEQARGENRHVGPPADVYALGAILYECLTGRPPFRAATHYETLLQVLHDEPAAPRQLNAQVPRDLETIVLKCLEKESARRYASAAALGDDLRRFLGGEPIRARAVGRIERAVKWVRRNPAVAALIAAVALSLIIGTGVSLVQANRAVRQAKLASDNEAKAVEALAETERTLLRGLLRPIGQQGDAPGRLELAILLDLHELPRDELRERFLEQALTTDVGAAAASRRAGWVAQALVGVDAGRRREVEAILDRHLRSEKSSVTVREACGRVAAALDVRDRELAGLAAAALVAGMHQSLSSKHAAELARDVARLQPIAGGEHAANAGFYLLAALLVPEREVAQDREGRILQVGLALSAVLETLPRDEAQRLTSRAYRRVLELHQNLAYLGETPHVLASLAGYLTEAEATALAADAARSMAGRLEQRVRDRTPWDQLRDLLLLAILGERLPPAEARRIVGPVADAVIRRLDPGRSELSTPSDLISPLQRLAPFVSGGEAARATRLLARAMSEPRPPQQGLSVIEWLLPQVPATDIPALADELVAGLTRGGGTDEYLFVEEALRLSIARLDAAGARRVVKALTAALDQKSLDSRAGGLVRSLAAALPLLPQDEAEATASSALRACARHGDDFRVEAIRLLAGHLSPKESLAAARLLVTRLGQPQDVEACGELAGDLATVCRRLPAADAQRLAREVLRPLLAVVGREGDSLPAERDRPLQLVPALGRLLAVLPPDEARDHALDAYQRITEVRQMGYGGARDMALALTALRPFAPPPAAAITEVERLVKELVPVLAREGVSGEQRTEAVRWVFALTDVLIPAHGRAVAQRLLAVSRSEWDAEVSTMDDAFADIARRLTTPDLASLLTDPLCAGASRDVLLTHLRQRLRRPFRSSWEVLDYLRRNGIDVELPAR